jgi:hypothetical protein
VRGRFPWCGCLFVSAAALAQSPDPEPLPFELNWQGPEACSGASETVAEIRRMLQNERPSASLTRITVSVDAQPIEESKWAIRVTTVSGELSGERQLRADSCDEARRAVALLVALMIDPDARVTNPEPSISQPGPTRPPEARPRTVVSARPPTSTEPHAGASRLAPRAFLGANLVADNGTLPSVDLGGRLDFGLNARAWALALRAGTFAPRSKDYQGQAGSGANFHLYEGELAACMFGVRQGNAALQWCVGPHLYMFHASSYGVSSPGSTTQLSYGVFGELALRYGFARGVAVRLGLEGLVPFQKPRFAIQDLGHVYQQASFAERISLGPEFEL